MNWQFEQLDPAYGGVSEGPVWNGDVLRFTHIQASRIMQYDPASGKVTLWRGNTNCANGMAYDAQGRLLLCEGGATADARRVTRMDLDGSITVLADSFEGKRLNIPNDIVSDGQGRIW